MECFENAHKKDLDLGLRNKFSFSISDAELPPVEFGKVTLLANVRGVPVKSVVFGPECKYVSAYLQISDSPFYIKVTKAIDHYTNQNLFTLGRMEVVEFTTRMKNKPILVGDI